MTMKNSKGHFKRVEIIMYSPFRIVKKFNGLLRAQGEIERILLLARVLLVIILKIAMEMLKSMLYKMNIQ